MTPKRRREGPSTLGGNKKFRPAAGKGKGIWKDLYRPNEQEEDVKAQRAKVRRRTSHPPTEERQNIYRGKQVNEGGEEKTEVRTGNCHTGKLRFGKPENKKKQKGGNTCPSSGKLTVGKKKRRRKKGGDPSGKPRSRKRGSQMTCGGGEQKSRGKRVGNLTVKVGLDQAGRKGRRKPVSSII